jgi:phosphoenolpyruvate carboxykinase (ATP)
MGIKEPKTAFSACFGAPFLPLHPAAYADLLGKKLRKSKANVWLINTGWSGGPYGVGQRMKLKYTRAMITAALNGQLDKVDFAAHPVFGVDVPQTCPDVPAELLNPRNTWADPAAYDAKAKALANQFIENFKKYEDGASDAIKGAGPRI